MHNNSEKHRSKILLLGGTGFIGRNLLQSYLEEDSGDITIFARNELQHSGLLKVDNVRMVEGEFERYVDLPDLVKNQDIVYHLVCTTTPANSGKSKDKEVMASIAATTTLLDACVDGGVGKVIFLSSGGAIYGANGKLPSVEEDGLAPLSFYGYQKQAIEELYKYYGRAYGLNYGIVRLSNPYGPFQNPTSGLGVVTTFIYKALKREPLQMFGDGSVVRDFLYVSDAVRGLKNIAHYDGPETTFNLGSGYGLSIAKVAEKVEEVLKCSLNIEHQSSRPVDVPKNYLCMDKYESTFGPWHPISLDEGIVRTARYLAPYFADDAQC